MCRVQSGHAASQNLVEGFNSQLRKVAKDEGHHRDATRLMMQLAARTLVWTSTRGDKLNICGEGQTKRALPSPAQPSKDLIEDENGRTIKVAGLRERWLVASGSNIHPVHPVFCPLRVGTPFRCLAQGSDLGGRVAKSAHRSKSKKF